MTENLQQTKTPYNRQTFIDKAASAVVEAKLPLKVIKSELTTTSPSRNYLEVSPYDQIYLVINTSFPMMLVAGFIDHKTTEKMLRTRRRMFIPDKKFSAIIRIDHDRQITIWSNKSTTELQFQGKWSSYEFIQIFLDLFFAGELIKISRLDINFDINKPMVFVAERLRVKRMRRRRTFEIIPPRIIKDPKRGICYEYSPSTEYHGKSIEFVLYDSGKHHGLGDEFSRIELRFKTMRVVPVKLFDEFNELPSKKDLFNSLVLPFEHQLTVLSHTELKHYKRLRNLSYRKNCSIGMAIDLMRERNRYQADCASRALRKAEKNYFNFNVAFTNNHEIFLKSKMSASERLFIDEVKRRMIEGI